MGSVISISGEKDKDRYIENVSEARKALKAIDKELMDAEVSKLNERLIRICRAKSQLVDCLAFIALAEKEVKR